MNDKPSGASSAIAAHPVTCQTGMSSLLTQSSTSSAVQPNIVDVSNTDDLKTTENTSNNSSYSHPGSLQKDSDEKGSVDPSEDTQDKQTSSDGAHERMEHKLHLFVRGDDIGTKPVFTDPQYTVLQLKQQISQQILDIPPDCFTLISVANSKPLHREHLRLIDCNIQSGTTIDIHMNLKGRTESDNSFHFVAECKNRFHIQIDTLSETDTVLRVKEIIQRNKGIKIAKLTLLKNNIVMCNDRALSEYNVKHGDTLFVKVKLVEVDYFDNLVRQKAMTVIDFDVNKAKNANAPYIGSIYRMFTTTSGKMNAEFIAMLNIERNRKQNLLIYQNLLSTMQHQNELCLFHGTTFENVEKIILNGFNRDYNIHAKYGKGTYFAKSARYAATYAKKDTQSNAFALLVCRCIVGKSGLGKKQMKRSELYDSDNPNQQYDSLVDDLRNPQIYVINRDYHAVPLYVILFRYKEAANKH